MQFFPKGLRYIPNFLSIPEKQKALEIINSHSWCQRLRRGQQYYGIKYFHTKYEDHILQGKESHDHFPLEELDFIRVKVKSLGIEEFLKHESPNQILVNRYLQRDQLGFHVEDVNDFGQCVLGLSLGSQDYLRLVPKDQVGQNKKGEIKLKLEDRSVYILEHEARYEWKHGIGRSHEGQPFKDPNFMRISLTFRDVIDTRRKL